MEKPPAPAAKPAKKPRAKRKTAGASAAAAVARLDEADIARARASGRAWDRHVRFGQGELFVHKTFGVGVVTSVTQDDFIITLFEDGQARRLIHAR